VTSGAARALGLEGEVGALRSGLWGDVAVVQIDRTDDADAALEAALASSHADLEETTIGGRVVYRR
jgi:imidazolonepropionase-like amidohydrolase